MEMQCSPISYTPAIKITMPNGDKRLVFGQIKHFRLENKSFQIRRKSKNTFEGVQYIDAEYRILKPTNHKYIVNFKGLLKLQEIQVGKIPAMDNLYAVKVVTKNTIGGGDIIKVANTKYCNLKIIEKD